MAQETDAAVKVESLLGPAITNVSIGDQFWIRRCIQVDLKGSYIDGPGSIIFDGDAALVNCTFENCDIICMRTEDVIYSAVGFENSRFMSCIFRNLTIFVSPAAARALRRDFRRGKCDGKFIPGWKWQIRFLSWLDRLGLRI